MKSNIPELRFPEFKNEPEWEENSLGKCLLKHPDYGVNAAAVPFSEKLPTYLRITDISVDGYYLSNEKVSVDIDATSDNYLEDGDIVLARTGASVGKSYKYRKEDGALVFAGFLIRVKPDKKKLNSDLLFHFFSTEKYWNWVNITSARSGQPGINGNEYANLPIPIPSTLAEQQKIADCLSSLNNLITAQSKKVEALKEHKKGLMQQLFPKDGEKVPKLRFPEFENEPEWEEKIVDDVVNRYDNLRVPVSAINRIAGKTPYYGANGIQGYVSGYTHDGEFILIAEDGANDLKNYPIQYVNGKIWVNNHAHVLQAKKNIAYNRFLKFAISKINIEPFLVGGGRAKLNANIMMKLKIKIPKPKEQQRIADFLSSIDELITSSAKKIEALKEHKKGLMQKLFPSNEVER